MLVVEPGRLSGCFATDEAIVGPGGHGAPSTFLCPLVERAAKRAIVDTKTALSSATQQLGNHNALPYPRIRLSKPGRSRPGHRRSQPSSPTRACPQLDPAVLH